MNKIIISLLSLSLIAVSGVNVRKAQEPSPPTSTFTIQPARPGQTPGDLRITTAGTYTGIAGHVTISARLNDKVRLDHLTFDNLECVNPCDLTITNCNASGREPTYAIVVWRFRNLVIENNLVGGRGILFRDFSRSAVNYRVRFNKLVNINGITGPDSRFKVSAIQAAELHIGGEIAWNWVANTRGQSATEDAISAMRSGGAPDSPMLIHDNLVDGVFNWPLITPGNHLHFTGCGIMCFDPGDESSVTAGGYTRIFNNIVLGCENQAYACAGGHDIEIFNNRAVNDGTSTPFGTVAYQVWNFAHRTPDELFGKGISVHDNFSYWLVAGKSSEWGIDQPAEQRDNTAGISSEAAERAAWLKRCHSAGMVIGPR